MEGDDIVKTRYGQLLLDLAKLPDESAGLTAPLLVAGRENWRFSEKRVLFVGQETRDWGWSKNGNDLQEVKQNANALDLLLGAYKNFDFGREYPALARAPFWRFFYRLEKNPDWSLLWTNLIKIAVPPSHSGKNSHSFLNSALNLRLEINKWQQGTLLTEIAGFRPTHVVFATGPNYDGFIKEALGDIELVEMQGTGFNARAIAIVNSSSVHIPMIRMYHPAYAQRKGLFDRLGELLRKFVDETKA